jgi:hypothetical protein
MVLGVGGSIALLVAFAVLSRREETHRAGVRPRQPVGGWPYRAPAILAALPAGGPFSP